MHLIKREGCRRHSNQRVEEVGHELCLRVQGKQEDRRGCTTAHHSHLPLPQTIELVKGIPASFC